MTEIYIQIRRIVYITLGIINGLVLLEPTDIFILCYHSINDDKWKFSIKLGEFKKQINYLKNQGYQFIALSELLAYIEGRVKLSRPSVVISFDDGYKDFLQTKEFLKQLGIKPALFVLSDTKHANFKELDNHKEFLSKKDILDLIKVGWEIGSHTATHSNMNTLSDKQIVGEIIDSKRKLNNELKKPINYITFPKGRYNPKIIKAVQKAGYKMALTMDDGRIYKGMNKYLIPRIGVDGTHSFNEFKTLFLPLNIKVRKFLKEHGYGK